MRFLNKFFSPIPPTFNSIFSTAIMFLDLVQGQRDIWKGLSFAINGHPFRLTNHISYGQSLFSAGINQLKEKACGDFTTNPAGSIERAISSFGDCELSLSENYFADLYVSFKDQTPDEIERCVRRVLLESVQAYQRAINETQADLNRNNEYWEWGAILGIMVGAGLFLLVLEICYRKLIANKQNGLSKERAGSFQIDFAATLAHEISDNSNQEKLEELCDFDWSSIPAYYKCPIGKQVMTVPVIINDGETYELENIGKWYDEHGTCPRDSNKKITSAYINRNFETEIKIWVEDRLNKMVVNEPVNVVVEDNLFLRPMS